jgi:uncharacterized protein YdeI (YjbR/CyaY-like superfamily)
MKGSNTVDEYIIGQGRWRSELIELRNIIAATGLDESIKWGVPVYSYNDQNILGIAAFKTYVAIWFYQGSLLKDTEKKLINAQEGTTKALRQWRFNSFDEIEPQIITEYIIEAIENEKSGNKIKPTAKNELEMPEELIKVFDENAGIKLNFEKLTPFKRREYLEFLQSAKRQETKEKRLEKIIPLLMAGIGLNDKYR